MSAISGKVVVVTGASSGIGLATARMLAKTGASVVLGARREARLKELAESIEKDGGQAAWRVTDVAKREDMRALVDLAIQRFGKMDALVNSAGVAQNSRIDDLQVEDWEEMIDINIRGTLYGIAAALPVFKEQGSGHIINIISTSGIRLLPTQGVYAGTKNAVRAITEILRQESGDKLRVTEISPGMIATELVSRMKDPAMRQHAEERTKIAVSPDAIARAVVFALEQPADVEIGSIVVRPTAQG